MGSIYKLKPEIVDFIVEQKRQNPKLSCRKFTDMLAEQFQTKISKSAVNLVLKGARLSSPIGRPVSGKNLRTFKIPEHKKQELFVQSTPQKAVQQVTASKEMSKQYVKAQSKMELSDGLGAIFLKAAQWDVFSGELMAYLVRRHLKGNSSPDIDKVAEALLYVPIFGVKNINDLNTYKGSGLWKLIDVPAPIAYQDIGRQIENIRGFTLDVENELLQIFSEANYFKFALEDNTQFCIDAQQISLWPDNVQSEFTISVNKATAILSRHFINNVQSAIIQVFPESEKEMQEFLSAFENFPKKKIKRIEILDTRHQKIAEYSIIPSKRRTFICGLWPWQAKFTEVTLRSNIRTLKPVFVKTELGGEFFFKETPLIIKIGQESFKIRLILIQSKLSQVEEFAIVTNIEADIASQVIIKEYLDRWPNLGQSESLNKLRSIQASDKVQAIDIDRNKDAPDFISEPNFVASFQYALNFLNEYCKKHFFPPSYREFDINKITSMVYGLKGFLKKTDQYLVVDLEIPEAYPYKESLEYAIASLNEADVKDLRGRKVFLKHSYLV